MTKTQENQAILDRTRLARERSPHKTQSSMADALEIARTTYPKYESRSVLPPDLIVRFCKLSGVSMEWLLTGADSFLESKDSDRDQLSSGALLIQELDVTASAGSGALDGAINQDAVIADWVLPSDYIRGRTDAPAPALKIIRVEGDSMTPDFPPGSRVMVNINDKTPSPPGVFVVWDGLGLVMKRVEPIYGSEPQRVRLSSINAAYSSYEATLEEAHINGRVIGKWQWT